MRVLIIKKKYLLLSIIAIICAIILSMDMTGGVSASVYFGYAPRLVPIYSVDIADKKVAITFDTAWGADKTLKILDTLDEYGAKATFFMVGFWVEKYPDMVRAVYEHGIEIGTHSNTHPDFVKLSSSQMELELTTSIQHILDVVDVQIELFRCPYGSYNNSVISTANSLNLKTIQWDVDTLDWKGLSGLEICERVMSRVKSGSIILCHNNSDHILDALPLMLERLKNAGYTVVSVGELIYQDNYYVDHLGIQRKN